LAVSHNATYLVGQYENHRFTPEKRGRLDFGRFYVPQFIQGPKGQRIMWAWAVTTRPRNEQIRVGWASMQTLPRVLSLAEDGTILFEPAKELQTLRHDHRRLENLQLDDSEQELPGVTGGQLEIDVTFQPQDAKSFGLVLDLSPRDAVVCYDVATGILNCNEYRAPVKLGPGEPLSLRIFFDRSIIEIFANNRVCLTGRIYPHAPEKVRARLFVNGGKATTSSLDTWRLRSIWEEK
jgi:beta-fructofuranosidase